MIGRALRFRALLGIAAVLALLGPLSAHAWNGAGHRMVAAIAWERLAPGTKVSVSALLRQHPDYLRWIRRGGDSDPERTAFIEASTWPDDIRSDTRFYTVNIVAPTPVLPGFADMERHLDWHYYTLPIDAEAGKAPLTGQLGKQLVALSRMLNASNENSVERVDAVPWLIHLVGDAHQPLHTSVRTGINGKWDRLGNGFVVSNPFNNRKPLSTLHAFWDDLPGPSWLRGEKLDAASAALAARFPPPEAMEKPDRWIEESWRLAIDMAYPPSSETTPSVITDAFYKQSREIAARRIALAGYRLADLLNRSLAHHTRTPETHR